jgi:hypothetical protein
VLAGFRYKLQKINHVSGPKIIVDLGGGTDIFNGLLADLGNELSVFDILKFDDAWIGENNNFEVPNFLNHIKRIKVLFGYTNYIPYTHYFNAGFFTGHVREYSVGDLSELSCETSMSGARVYGRNFFGSLYASFGYNALTKFIDRILRLRAGVCSSLYLVWSKPNTLN